MQNHASLTISGDLAGGQRGAVRQNLKVSRKVCFPEGDVHEIAALGCIEFSHGLHNTASQEGIFSGTGLNNVGGENFGNDDIGPKGRHR